MLEFWTNCTCEKQRFANYIPAAPVNLRQAMNAGGIWVKRSLLYLLTPLLETGGTALLDSYLDCLSFSRKERIAISAKKRDSKKASFFVKSLPNGKSPETR